MIPIKKGIGYYIKLLGVSGTCMAAAFAGNSYADDNSAQLQDIEQRLQAAEQQAKDADQRAQLAEERASKAQEAIGQDGADQSVSNSKDMKDGVAGMPVEQPKVTMGINYFYMRSGVGVSDKGGTAGYGNDNQGFHVPTVSDNNAGRLGNEYDTYLEPSFKATYKPKDGGPEFGGVVTFTSYLGERSSQTGDAQGIGVLDLYTYGKDAIDFLPGSEVWAGRRSYEYQVYMNIIDRRSAVIGGNGGGINNINLGDVAKLDVAFLENSPGDNGTTNFVGSSNTLPSGANWGDIRTVNGNLDKVAGYSRLHDIELPLIGGKSSFWVQVSHTGGGRAITTGTQDTAVDAYSANATDIHYGETDGISIGYSVQHDIAAINGKNLFYIGAGWGDEYDTTNSNHLQQNPYYATLALTGHTYTLASASSAKLGDQVDFSLTKNLEAEAYLVYEHQNDGRPTTVASGLQANGSYYSNNGTQDWLSIGIRPAYHITNNFAIVTEATYNYVDNRAFEAERAFYNANPALGGGSHYGTGAGNLGKFTVAPTFYTGTVFSTPFTISAYATVAAWDDNLRGSNVGGDVFKNDNWGLTYGTQAVISF